HIFDWLIGNHDGHAENLIITADGQIVGIDKGQLFKFYDQDRLDWTYNPNQAHGVIGYHNQLLQRWAEGEEVFYASYDHPVLAEFLGRIQSLDDEEFKRIIRPYAEAAYRFRVSPGRRALAYQDIDVFLQQAVERKNRIAQDFVDLYRRAKAARDVALARLRPAVEAATPITEEFVQEVEASGWQGKALMFGGEDIEDMHALIYRVDGDGTLIDLKVRRDAERKILATLEDITGGIVTREEGDPYWNDVLAVVKSYNYHLKPDSLGYDGQIPVHTRDKITELWMKLYAERKQNPAAQYYYDIITPLYEEVVPRTRPLGGQVGKIVKQFVPKKARPRHIEGRRRLRASKTPARMYYVRNERGRIVWQGGKTQTFRGNGVHIEFDDDIRADYMFHGDDNGNIYSKQGRMLIQVDGELTPEKLNRVLRHLGDLGLETRLATREDMEFLYLIKVSYAAGVDFERMGITPDMSIGERIEVMVNYWSKRLGVADVRKLPSYAPMPRFDSPAPVLGVKQGRFGIPRWRRFDITEEDLNREMRGYVLTHSLYNGDVVGSLRLILENNGALVATEEKMRIGIPVSGMSPVRDQETGGASYVFTRIRSASAARYRDYHLLFDKRLLLDPDVISYSGDYYGNVHPDHIRRRRRASIEGWKAAAKSPGNETIIKRNLSLYDYLVGINVRSAEEKQQVIDLLQRYGIKRLDGRPLEKAVRVAR
ncbi:MAG: hypothetical protein J7M34_05050, partial [Anaerolineae bacterium]|nr:hypothetical protein [Anaerolineae bacterium]